MIFHIERPLPTNYVFHDGRMIMKIDLRGYSSLLSDLLEVTRES
jgi:hypothetical protein